MNKLKTIKIENSCYELQYFTKLPFYCIIEKFLLTPNFGMATLNDYIILQ